VPGTEQGQRQEKKQPGSAICHLAIVPSCPVLYISIWNLAAA